MSKIKEHQESEVKVRESCCFKANPYFDSDQSGEDAASGKEGSLEVAKAKDQGDPRVMIGDPEELVMEEVRESCLPDTNFPANCIVESKAFNNRSKTQAGGNFIYQIQSCPKCITIKTHLNLTIYVLLGRLGCQGSTKNFCNFAKVSYPGFFV